MSEPSAQPLPVRTFTSDTATAQIADQGAQPLRWQPAGFDPVLWLSPRANLQVGRSVRGGSPICWPWFGPGRTPGLAPAHGFVRTAPWQHVDTEVSRDAVTVTHHLDDELATSEHFPYSYAARHRTVFGAAYEQSLTITNTGDAGFDFEEALHAYLVVGDIRQASIAGLDGVSYWDKTTGRDRAVTGDLTFTGETDAVLATGGPVHLLDPVLGRRITVSTSGAANLVVWNPWADKAAEVADIGPDAWTGFVCIEGANAFANAVALAPGQSHTLTYRLEVDSL